MKDGYSYSHSLFFSSFLVFWYWSSKSGPSLLLLNYSQRLLFLSSMCRLIHECSCLMRWGIGIDLAHGSSLGVTPRVTCWQGWQNDGVSLKRSHWGEHISVCWRGSMTLSLYCLEGIITKIEKLSCQAVSGLEVVLTNKWWLVDQIFVGFFFSDLSFKVEGSKHEIMWNMVQVMGSSVAMVITQLWVNVPSKNSSTTFISLRIDYRARLKCLYLGPFIPQDLIQKR